MILTVIHFEVRWPADSGSTRKGEGFSVSFWKYLWKTQLERSKALATDPTRYWKGLGADAVEIKGSCTKHHCRYCRPGVVQTQVLKRSIQQRIDGVSATGLGWISEIDRLDANESQLSKDSEDVGREETARVDPWNFRPSVELEFSARWAGLHGGNFCLWEAEAVATCLLAFLFHGQRQNSSGCVCLQCNHQCLWEGWPVAAGTDLIWGHAKAEGWSESSQLQCHHQRLCKGWWMEGGAEAVW